MAKMSPFWYLCLGLGTAFVITSGRAKAIYDVITGEVSTAPAPYPGIHSTGDPAPGGGQCPNGYIWDSGTRTCIKVTPVPQCPPGSFYDPAKLKCVPQSNEQ